MRPSQYQWRNKNYDVQMTGSLEAPHLDRYLPFQIIQPILPALLLWPTKTKEGRAYKVIQSIKPKAWWFLNNLIQPVIQTKLPTDSRGILLGTSGFGHKSIRPKGWTHDCISLGHSASCLGDRKELRITYPSECTC